METKPPDDYPFSFTLAELFDLTLMVKTRHREVEIQLGQAYLDGDARKQRIFSGVLQRLSDLHGMLNVPITQLAEDIDDLPWLDAEVTEADNDDNPFEEIEPDDLKDYFYKN